MFYFQFNDIESLVKNLPFLRHLHINILFSGNDLSFALMVLSKCPYLETLIIASDVFGFDFEFFTSVQFFNDFHDCIQMRDVTIAVKSREEKTDKKL